MPLATSCPSCATRIGVPDSAAGQQVRCPRCGGVFTAPSAAYTDSPPTPARPLPVPVTATRPRHAARGGLMPVILGGSALAVALLALGLNLFRGNPLGAGLSKYDFSTPRAALTADWEMKANGDIRALMEVMVAVEGPRLREALKTLGVRKEAEWRGKTILFIQYERDGVKKYETVAMEKDAKSGIWMNSKVGASQVQSDNFALAEQMRSWQQTGRLPVDKDKEKWDEKPKFEEKKVGDFKEKKFEDFKKE